MPVRQINLDKLNPCYQNWEAMKACSGGRICNDCNKVIVDFRKMNPHEIALKHASSSEPVCGIYAKETSKKEMEFLSIDKRIKKYALGLFTLMSVSQYPELVKANEPSIIQLIGDENRIHKDEIAKYPNRSQDSIIIGGTVFSQERGSLEPIPFATIFIKGTEKGTNTDFEGKFTLAFTKEFFERDTITLVVQYIGHSKLEKRIQIKSQRIDLVLTAEYELVAFGVVVLPWHRRIWRKLTSPFTKKY